MISRPRYFAALLLAAFGLSSPAQACRFATNTLLEYYIIATAFAQNSYETGHYGDAVIHSRNANVFKRELKNHVISDPTIRDYVGTFDDSTALQKELNADFDRIYTDDFTKENY